MSELQAWRELLAEVIKTPQERQRIAAALGVHPLTLMRWIRSTKPDYFRSPALLDLLRTYATLLALAFDPEDFYEPQSIKLGVMPSLQVQDSYFVTFQQRVNSALKKAIADQHPLNYLQAEQRVWWQIAEELLRVSPRLLPET